MSVLTDIQILTGTSLTEAALNIHIRRGTSAIKNYLNNNNFTDDYIQTNFPDAVVEYVIERMNKKGNEGLKQFTQGSRSGTYDSSGLSDDVKVLLPAPYAKLR